MPPEKKNSRPDGNLRHSFKSAQQVKNLLALFLYAFDKNQPMEYDDTLVRQIIECVVVESKEKIKAVFIGDTEIEMTL